MKCVSCNTEHDENFCPNCGQRNGVMRITISSIVESTFSTFVNMDRGFLFNLKSLFLAPKKTVLEYIKGKRKGILNPISYLILTISLYLIIITIVRIPKDPTDIISSPKSGIRKIAYEIGYLLRAYIKYFWIFSIIPLGATLKLLFRKHNFPEYLAISSFIIGQATAIGIVSYLLFKIPLFFDPVVFGVISLLIFKIFKQKNNVFESLLITFAALILFILQWIVLIIILGVLKVQFDF
ncbi:Protein of unknown function [Tenacibaculum sp. MAR_2009_124]|uniref:DUF3667 domain-containing protein n=1 Tax=Tenacibaculum sp. MAR_2009_124 TaxID=1250059 RepID=UPI000895F2E7|nr:DUF3667 domain-containing protein [Tenacibaculum sp. MAR_2009_124]SEC77670.1 Protein of unknown function [Tenacibaculum sp. MAR_2009_124]